MSKNSWQMDEAERDALKKRPVSESAAKAKSAAPIAVIGELESLTPPPVDTSALAAWEHATQVQRRTANALTAIAQSAGVGMEVADKIRELEARVGENEKKLKRWQAFAMSALVAAGSSVFGVVKGLYERGALEGAMTLRVQIVEREVERLRAAADSLREKILETGRRSWPFSPDNKEKQ